MNYMNYSLITKARQALQPLWERAPMRGNCWGPKSEKNPYSGTNIILCVGSELVSISQQGDRLLVHEFRRTTDTKLGQRTKEILRNTGLIQKTKEILSSSGYTGYCTVCGWREEFDAGLAGEVDSGGTGSRELARKIYQRHEVASPGCDPANVEVLDSNMVKQKRLTQLIALERVK